MSDNEPLKRGHTNGERRLTVAESSPRRPSVTAVGRRLGGEAEVRLRFASILRISDRLISGAVAAYDRLVSLSDEDRVELYCDTARSFVEQKQYEGALEAYRKALALRPNDASIWLELGRLQLLREAPKAAIFAFEKAGALEEESFDVHEQLGAAWLLVDRHDKAADAFERALRLRPESAETAYRLGMALDALGRHEEAIDALEIAVELSPKHVGYHQALGFAYESSGQRDNAVKCFKQALQLEQASVPVRAKKVRK